ncbi:MAG: hypothetical protein Tsb0013_15560 [Phycisphaerales bacterium]
MLTRSLVLTAPLLIACAGHAPRCDAALVQDTQAALAPPELPADIETQARAHEEELARARTVWLSDSTETDARRAALNEAIESARALVDLRTAHQGNAPRVRWSDGDGDPMTWYELSGARATLEDLRTLAALEDDRLEEAVRYIRDVRDAEEVFRAGRVVDAKNMLLASSRQLRPLVGDTHIDRARALAALAVVRQNMYEVEEAERHLRDALAIYRERLGPEHPSTLTTTNTLALVLNASGRIDEATALFRRILAAQERVLGPDDPSTLVSVLNLGFIALTEQGPEPALELFERAYKGLSEALGETHPTTLTSAEGIGVAMQRQGRLDDAEGYYLGVEAGRRRTMGPEHPDTLRAAFNVATVHALQGRLAEAEFRFSVAAEGRRRQLGEGHPLVIETLGDLASVQLRQGKLESAESFASRALDGWRRTLGDDHPETLDAMERLARIALEAGRSREVLDDIGRIEDARRRSGGSEQAGLDTAIAMRAEALLAIGRYPEAAAHFAELTTPANDAATRGAHDPRVLRGAALLLSGDAASAEETLARTADGLAARLGDDHPRTLRARALHARAVFEDAPGADTSDALAGLLQRCERELGAHDPSTIALAYTLALAVHNDDPERAESLYAMALRRALDARPSGVPRDAAPDASEIACGYARLLIDQDRYDEAYAVVQRARAHGFFAALARAGMDRTVLRATGMDETARSRYESLLTVERDARARLNEMHLRRNDDPALIPTDDLAEADERLARATSDVLAFINGASPALAPRDADDAMNALGPGDGCFEVIASRTAVVAFTCTRDSIRGHVLADTQARVASLRAEASVLRERLTVALPDEPPEQDIAGALRDDLVTPGVREHLDGSAGTLYVSSAPLFDGVPMHLLFPGRAVSRTAPLGPLPVTSDAGGPDLDVGFGALTLSARDREEADLYLQPLARFMPNGLLRIDTRSSSPDELRTEIATKRPRRLHLLMPAWFDGWTIASRMPDPTGLKALGPTLTVFDLLETGGPNLAGVDLVVAPQVASVGSHRDTFGPLLLIAGVDTVVYALWDVDPVAGALLTGRFYANTTGQRLGIARVDGKAYGPGEPMPPSEALREARGWLRTLGAGAVDRAFVEMDLVDLVTAPVAPDSDDARPYAHPHYWSGFVLAGIGRE